MDGWILALVTGTQAVLFCLTFVYERRAKRFAAQAEWEAFLSERCAIDASAHRARAAFHESATAEHVARLTREAAGRTDATETAPPCG